MKIYDIQQKLLTETLPPREPLKVALIDEKGILNHLKLSNDFKSNGPSVLESHNHFNVKREPTLNIERINTCMKCGGTISKGHLAVCPGKEITCTSCKFKAQCTRLCKSCRKNVNIENTQIVDNADFNPSNHPDVNIDHVDREGVHNAWSESGQSEIDDYSVLNTSRTERLVLCSLNSPPPLAAASLFCNFILGILSTIIVSLDGSFIGDVIFT